MLKNRFFTITFLEAKEGLINARFVLNGDHEIFKGHFPENPVTPGVCQIQIVKELLCEVRNIKLYLIKAKSIKFLKMLVPSVRECSARIEIEQSEEYCRVNALISEGDEPTMKFRGLFSTAFPVSGDQPNPL